MGIEEVHTEKLKKDYSIVEREIKRKLTEIFLLSKIWLDKYTCRWLSITKDFKIRELSPNENSKFLSNPSTIKSPTLTLTQDKVKKDLFNLIDKKIKDKSIAEKYKIGIKSFLHNLSQWNIKYIIENTNESSKFFNYLKQQKNVEIEKKNVSNQIAKIVFNKFWEDAFDISIEWWKETIVLSKKSLNYIYTIFYNANKVRESRWNTLDQVFLDWNFPFITDNILATEEDYITVIIYLVDKSKKDFYEDKWEKQADRSRKTSKYADILRALTDKQLWITATEKFEETPEFKRDYTTNQLKLIWWWLLENEIDDYNIQSKRTNTVDEIKLSKRLKSLSSCTEKIIEWRKINDIIWLRLSTKWISQESYESIKEISIKRFNKFNASLISHPEKYVPTWHSISIKEISVDNKWVLTTQQVDEIIKNLNNIVHTWKRQKNSSPYINQGDREERIYKYYPEITQDTKKWDILKTFFSKISWWKERWKNWWYKDFKFNITFEIKDEKGNVTWNRNMEVQFDDTNNWKWMANFNIRNFERWLNTQSRLSFSSSLTNVRKNCERNLKKMQQRITNNIKDENEKKEFFELNFDDWTKIDISSFNKRDEKNSKKIDEAIIKIINYFIDKWTFLLYYHTKPEENQNAIHWKKNQIWKRPKKSLTLEDLHNKELMENLRICSSLELASQQHSYLQKNWNDYVWIYIPSQKWWQEIWRIKLWELIDPMNLGKVKDEKFSANI